MKKTLLLLTIAVLCLGTYASADNFGFYTSRAASVPSDVIDWGQLGPPGSLIDTPAIVFSASGTNAALVGNNNLGQFITMQEGYNWGGNFDYGENLVWTGNPNLGIGGGGPFVVEFALPVGTVGFGIQTDFYGAFTAYVSLYDASLNYMTTFAFNGNSFFSEAGDNLFIGIQDATAVNIGAILIDSVSPAAGSVGNSDFAIDAVSFNYATPEPGSLLLLGSGLIGVAGVVRRKLGA